MRALNHDCFSPPKLQQQRALASGFDAGSGRSNGGMSAPVQVHLRRHQVYYRFGDTARANADLQREAAGGWWIEYEVFARIRAFAREHAHLQEFAGRQRQSALSYAIKLHLAVPYEWGDSGVVMTAELLQPLDAFRGLGNPARLSGSDVRDGGADYAAAARMGLPAVRARTAPALRHRVRQPAAVAAGAVAALAPGGVNGPRQLHLFGEPEPAPPVRPAPVPAALTELAARLPPGLRLGTSSWAFAGWAGAVYAAGSRPALLSRHGLAAYGQHPLLRTVGIDRTFYAPVPAAALAAYAAQVPSSFRFLVKAWSGCTAPIGDDQRPNPHFLDAAVAVDRVVGPAVAGLGDQLGPIVFQFPPQPSPSPAFADRLQRFLAALPRGPQYAVELRDAELLAPPYAAALRAGGAVHCFSVHPRLPPIEAQRAVAPPGPLVLRWMLQPPLGYQQAKQRFAPFASLQAPDPGRRRALAELAVAALQRGDEVTAVINNKAEGSAPLSVFALAAEIAARLAAG